ncbi:hypothetical protein PCANC_16030 [Puccinia coronata f. sp. avenae]|uniref:Uncharacterized protein n=1 Tax=Puccinia coronata f. sp. avenae TaxID=200324 RepID=A0A2N5ULM9_9BASI|nr:hypothetical protein PCANC_16030 [Puccinia coronata f. sp. avenae]
MTMPTTNESITRLVVQHGKSMIEDLLSNSKNALNIASPNLQMMSLALLSCPIDTHYGRARYATLNSRALSSAILIKTGNSVETPPSSSPALASLLLHRRLLSQLSTSRMVIVTHSNTQLLGFALAGVTRRFLIWPAFMIWPSNLVSPAELIVHPYVLSQRPSLETLDRHQSTPSGFPVALSTTPPTPNLFDHLLHRSEFTGTNITIGFISSTPDSPPHLPPAWPYSQTLDVCQAVPQEYCFNTSAGLSPVDNAASYTLLINLLTPQSTSSYSTPSYSTPSSLGLSASRTRRHLASHQLINRCSIPEVPSRRHLVATVCCIKPTGWHQTGPSAHRQQITRDLLRTSPVESVQGLTLGPGNAGFSKNSKLLPGSFALPITISSFQAALKEVVSLLVVTIVKANLAHILPVPWAHCHTDHCHDLRCYRKH